MPPGGGNNPYTKWLLTLTELGAIADTEYGAANQLFSAIEN